MFHPVLPIFENLANSITNVASSILLYVTAPPSGHSHIFAVQYFQEEHSHKVKNANRKKTRGFIPVRLFTLTALCLARAEPLDDVTERRHVRARTTFDLLFGVGKSGAEAAGERRRVLLDDCLIRADFSKLMLF